MNYDLNAKTSTKKNTKKNEVLFKRDRPLTLWNDRQMYRIRFLIIIIKCLLSSTRDLLDDFKVTFRVIPFIDTDFLRLFTHSYSSYMALCRWNFVFNSKLRNVALKKGWAPVTTKEIITYKKSIKAFDQVVVQTKLICWNSKRFYLEQNFLVQGSLRAQCYVEGLLRGPNGIIEPPEVFKILGVVQNSPAFPAQIQELFPSHLS